MSNKQKKITIITVLTAISMVAIFIFIFISMQEPKFVSEIKYSASLSEVDGAHSLWAYWSRNSRIEDSYFEIVEGNKENVEFTFNEENEKPEVIYLHLKWSGDENKAVTRTIRTINYINKPSAITIEAVDLVTLDHPYMKLDLKTNGITSLKHAEFFISENMLSSQKSLEDVRFRPLFRQNLSLNEVQSLSLNWRDFNVVDGRFFLKVVTTDTANKRTIQVSSIVPVNYRIVETIIQNQRQTVDARGQLVAMSPIRVTGNSIIMFDVNNKDEEGNSLSINELVFSGDIETVDSLVFKAMNYEDVFGIKAIEGSNRNSIRIISDLSNFNGWYLVFYGDKLSGVFLHQTN